MGDVVMMGADPSPERIEEKVSVTRKQQRKQRGDVIKAKKGYRKPPSIMARPLHINMISVFGGALG